MVLEETLPDNTYLGSLPSALRAFMLPPGFPDSVTEDYLPYVLWSFPTHVTGWLYRSLTTASLLEGVHGLPHLLGVPVEKYPRLLTLRAPMQVWA